jgi:prepilin peptidase CpaA
MNLPSAFILPGVLLAVAALAAVIDARTGRIPNRLTFSAALLGVALHAVVGGGAGAAGSVAGLVVSACVPLILYRSTRGRAIGGGDVKLFAALGALAGPGRGIEIELSAFLLLAVFALVRLAVAGRLFRVLGNALRLLANPFLPGKWHRRVVPEAMTEMRMGPAIAVATASALALEHIERALPWLS